MGEIICIIPARGGSQRVKRKNILRLNNIPLISYTIRAAKEAGFFDRIVVSTEDPEIASVALAENIEVDDRPLELASNTATAAQVVKEMLERAGPEKYSTVVMLLPTCPFRTGKHLQEAWEMFNANPEIPRLIGVTEYEFPIQFALEPVSGNIMRKTFADGYTSTRSQDAGKRYHPNGAMYMSSVSAFMEKGSFFGDEMLTYQMSAIRSFDIDYPYQVEIAEVLSRRIDELDSF